MVTELPWAEILSFLGAILLAATASATARGLAADDDKPLAALRKLYLDLTGAFAGLTILTVAEPNTWSQSLLVARLSGSASGVALLPVAIGLLLIALLVGRQRWGSRTPRADLIVTFCVALVIAAAVVLVTSRPAAAQSFDRSAHRAFSSYCSGYSGNLTEIIKFTRFALEEESELSEGNENRDSNTSLNDEFFRLKSVLKPMPLMDAAPRQSESLAMAGISQRTKKKVKGEFCDALVIYLTLREMKE